MSDEAADGQSSQMVPGCPFPGDPHYLQAEFAELLQDPEILRFIDEAALDGLWYWDLDNPEHEWMSPGFWRTLGFDPAEKQHLASEWQDLIFPEDRDLALENFHRHLADPDHPYDQIVRYHTADGGTVTLRCRGMAIRENGAPRRMMGAHTLLHDTRTQEIDRKLTELLELSGDAIIAWTRRQGVVRWNRGAEQLYGVKQAMALGGDLFDLTRPEWPEGRAAVDRALAEQGYWTGKVTRRGADGTVRHTSTRLQLISTIDGKGGNGAAGDELLLQIDRDITELHEAEERYHLLARELNHRVKNLFAVVLSIIALSGRGQTDAGRLVADLRARVHALALAHEATQGSLEGENVPLRDVLWLTVSPHAEDTTGGADTRDRRVVLDGPAIALPVRSVTPVGLIAHELATNAAKSGALSSPGGRIAVRWVAETGKDGRRWLTLDWHEQGGPAPVTGDAVPQSGFGTTMMQMAAQQLGGTLERDWQEHGLRVRLHCPMWQE